MKKSIFLISLLVLLYGTDAWAPVLQKIGSSPPYPDYQYAGRTGANLGTALRGCATTRNSPTSVYQSRPSFTNSGYIIEVSYNDELFIINGEKFKAKTYCFNMEVGDPILFLEGSPLGACVSAVIYNKRTKRECGVWCE